MQTKMYWHIHHEILCESLTKPIENRIAFINNNKCENEIPIRLKWMTPVLGNLPKSILKAEADWQKPYADWQKAYADRQKAEADRHKAYADRQKDYADRQNAD